MFGPRDSAYAVNLTYDRHTDIHNDIYISPEISIEHPSVGLASLAQLIYYYVSQYIFSLLDPPSITASPASTVQILTSAMFNLSCSAEGQPYPTIVWLRTLSDGSHTVYNTSSISQNGRSFILSYNSISASKVMSIFSVDTSLISDTGNYSCTATNRLGSSSSNISMVSVYSMLHMLIDVLDNNLIFQYCCFFKFRDSFCYLSYEFHDILYQ